jgi:cyclophilin family peptidyl-prolyl cis-trans isomerase
MNSRIIRETLKQWLPALLVLFSVANSPAQYAGTNGIFAEFKTSMGNFTCVVYYASAPKAAASFIGLATGKKAWLDLPTGVVKTNKFYNGLTFHRVVPNFVIQTGSPNGIGTDGPGYVFVDETNGLRFNKFGMMAMANSGPDSNGSQFFILATSSYPSLNGGYTIFGQLFGGSNVVYAINHVATDANDKPLTNVTITTVKIVTNGAAAAAFYTNLNAQGLAVVTNLHLRIAKAGTNCSLVFSNRLYADNRLYNSSDLLSWNANLLGIETASPVSNTNLQAMTSAAQFYRAAQVRYPSTTFAPKNLFGRTLTLFYTNGIIGTNIQVFDSNGTGTYKFTGNPSGIVSSYSWMQMPYNGMVPLIFYSGSVLPPCQLKLNWKSVTKGNFSGLAYVNYPFAFGAVSLSGTFTNSP